MTPKNAELIEELIAIGDKVQSNGFSTKGKSKQEIENGLVEFFKKTRTKR